MESLDNVEETERNFTPEMMANWYRNLGYKEWRSLLSVPVLDSPSWVPVAVITLTSNLVKPFWAELDASEGGDLRDLMAAMRRAAKILVAEYKNSPLRQKALRRPMVASTDPSLIWDNVSRELRGASVLLNYSGRLNARWENLPAGGVTCFVSFVPEQVTLENVTNVRRFESVPIQITDGVDAELVEFRLDIISPTLRFHPSTAVVMAPAAALSPELVFECSRMPSDRITHRVFIQVFQKSRLIQVLRLEFARPKG
jgi:hypothetical protein